MTTDATTRSSRQTYLWRCIRVSISKRWSYAAVVGLTVLGLSVSLAQPLPLTFLLAAGAALLMVGAIAADSWRRHRHDFQAGGIR